MINRFFTHKKKMDREPYEPIEKIELEKGDLAAMLIAALLTFAPLVIILSLVYVGVAFLFGLTI